MTGTLDHIASSPLDHYDCFVAQPRKLHDRFFKLAKEEGYAARSAYKLKQINERHRVLRPGDRVLDLGCAPGSWLQVATELVRGGKKPGCVGGIDLKPVSAELPDDGGVRTLVGDIFKTDAAELMALVTPNGTSPRAIDVLLSDMAPSTEGGAGGSGDHFRSVELCRRVLQLAPALLRNGGALVMKVLEGEEYPALLKETQSVFAEVKGFKPEASRDVSREMFIVAKGFKNARGGTTESQETADPHAIAKKPPQPREGWGRGGGGSAR